MHVVEREEPNEMADERGEERRSGEDRRAQPPQTPPANAWQIRAFFLQFGSLLVILVGGLIGLYSRTTAIELSAARTEASNARVVEIVQTLTTEIREVKTEQRNNKEAANQRIDDANKRAELLEARIIVLEKSISRLEGRESAK
jgi:hypothetical protein